MDPYVKCLYCTVQSICKYVVRNYTNKILLFKNNCFGAERDERKAETSAEVRAEQMWEQRERRGSSWGRGRTRTKQKRRQRPKQTKKLKAEEFSAMNAKMREPENRWRSSHLYREHYAHETHKRSSSSASDAAHSSTRRSFEHTHAARAHARDCVMCAHAAAYAAHCKRAHRKRDHVTQAPTTYCSILT